MPPLPRQQQAFPLAYNAPAGPCAIGANTQVPHKILALRGHCQNNPQAPKANPRLAACASKSERPVLIGGCCSRGLESGWLWQLQRGGSAGAAFRCAPCALACERRLRKRMRSMKPKPTSPAHHLLAGIQVEVDGRFVVNQVVNYKWHRTEPVVLLHIHVPGPINTANQK